MINIVPEYESMVLNKFADLLKKKQVFRGGRAVFWSID